MTNRFLDNLETAMNGDGNVAYTENGAMAYASTGSTMLDFFSNGGALRTRSPNDIVSIFDKAYAEEPLLAAKAMFYFRDVRGGQGERRTFRVLLAHCAFNHPEVVTTNLALLAEYGRWDDLYALVDTPLEDSIWPLIDVQLAEDMRSERPSLLAKWLASENASSKITKRCGRKTRQALNMSPKTYRKTLSAIRKKIGLVEHRISMNEWGGIDYGRIPSKAGIQYRKAFYRHDAERYKHFLEQVDKGEKTMNVGTLYPYEIVRNFISRSVGIDSVSLNTMWNSLPDYFDGEEVRGLVVADVSGSMSWSNGGLPMAISVSLAIYTAEHNTGPFAGKYITFSGKPSLITVKENTTIEEKIRQVMITNVGYNTDIEAVFDLVLNVAKRNKMSQDELPSHLYVISDMEFDDADVGGSRMNKRLFEVIAERYEDAGYKMPLLVFWNVDSRNDQQPMSLDHLDHLDQRGFQLVSGASASTFTSLLANKNISAFDLMVEVLNANRYEAVQLGE